MRGNAAVKALCKKSLVITEDNDIKDIQLLLFKEGSTYKVWEGFYEKEPVLYAEAETGEIVVIEDSPELEKAENFQEFFEITSYVD